MAVEQLDQPPDADAAAEFALGELHRRFVEQTAQQHGVEVGREVHRHPHAMRPVDPVDEPVAGVEIGGLGLQRGDVAIERVGDLVRGVHGQRPPATASVVPVM